MKKLILLFIAALFTSGAVFADPYVRLSGGSSSWDSPTADLYSTDTQPLFDDRDNAIAIAIGQHVTDDFRVELEYTDFGSGDLAFNDSYEKCFFKWCKQYSDDYMTEFDAHAVTGWVVYDVYTIGEKYPVAFNVRGGFSYGNMDATINDVKFSDSDGGVAYGLGVDVAVWKGLSLNASWEQHSFVFENSFDYEPKVAKLGATWTF